ncbi:YqeG family HAD IIIA-type phosphatase [Candidatus Margulisiibacteriota bacterium]
MKIIKKVISEYISILKKIFLPSEVSEKVEDIHLEGLYHEGYRSLLLDIDNTILSRSERNITLEKMNWINKCKTVGFDIYLVSNNSSSKRVRRVSEQINVYEGLYFSCKPMVLGILDLADVYNINLKKTVIIGDQLFTDVIAGNWLGAYTCLVDPMDKKLSIIKTVQREVELFFLKKLSKFDFVRV